VDCLLLRKKFLEDWKTCYIAQCHRTHISQPILFRNPWDSLVCSAVFSLLHSEYSTPNRNFKIWSCNSKHLDSNAGVCETEASKPCCSYLLILLDFHNARVCGSGWDLNSVSSDSHLEIFLLNLFLLQNISSINSSYPILSIHTKFNVGTSANSYIYYME
jgi:hypothetical protein